MSEASRGQFSGPGLITPPVDPGPQVPAASAPSQSLGGRVLQAAAGLLGHALRVFGLAHLAIDVLLGGLLGTLCFLIAFNGSILRGGLAAAVAVALVVAFGSVVAAKIAVAAALARIVRQAGLGRVVLRRLFEQALGVTDAGVAAGSVAAGMHGLSVAELQRSLDEAADGMIEAYAPAGPAGLARWVARRVHRLLVRLTVRAVVGRCRRLTPGGGTLDVLAIRDRLAGQIDEAIIACARAQLARVGLALGAAVALAAAAAALGLRQLPI